MIVRNVLTFMIAYVIAFSSHVFGFDVPVNDNYVTDIANVLTATEEEELETSMYTLRQETDVETAILLLSTLSGEAIEEVGLQVAEERGVGDKEKDNGIVIVAAIEDREIRIDIGYGLEHLLTDGRTKRIIDNNVPYYFRQGEYGEGLKAVLFDISALLKGDVDISTFDGNNKEYYSGYTNEVTEDQLTMIVIFSVIFIILGFGLMMEFVVTDPNYNKVHKKRAKEQGKKKPYIHTRGWFNLSIIFIIFAGVLTLFTALFVISAIVSFIILLFNLFIALQEPGSGGGKGSSYRSSSSSYSGSSRSSSSSSSRSSSSSSFGGFSGGSFGGGGASSSR